MAESSGELPHGDVADAGFGPRIFTCSSEQVDRTAFDHAIERSEPRRTGGGAGAGDRRTDEDLARSFAAARFVPYLHESTDPRRAFCVRSRGWIAAQSRCRSD